MAFAADFVGGLAGGLGQGVNMYAQLQQMAQAQKQQEYQQQLMEQRNQAQEAKTQQDKLNTLLNIAKLKPDVREYALQTVGPSLGLDPNDPQIKALLAGAGMDENFVTNLRGAGRQFGLTPEQTGVLEAADPNVAAQQLFGFNRAQQSNELGQERLGLSEQRLGLATQGQELSAQRLREQMDRFDQRMAGNIPPIGFKPGFDQLGGLTSLTAVPGGPQTIPTGEERKAADQFTRAQGSLERANAFMQANPDYLASTQAQIDAALAGNSEEVVGGAGAALGAIVGGAAGSAAGHPYAGVAGGLYAGRELGKGLSSTVERLFTSDKGKAFKAAWAPFINANLRRETGATINPHEWVDAFARFIPMPGDDSETMAIKGKNRNDALEGIKLGADRAMPQEFSTPAKQVILELAKRYKAGTLDEEGKRQLQEALRAAGKL